MCRSGDSVSRSTCTENDWNNACPQTVVRYAPRPTVTKMISRAVVYVLTIVAGISVAGCAGPQQMTPASLTARLDDAGTRKVQASWTWGAGKGEEVRMTGKGEWSHGGSVRKWVNTWNGTSISAVITPVGILVEDGSTLDPTSREGEYRIQGDLFASADPLKIADEHGIVLQGQGDKFDGRADCSTSERKCMAQIEVQLDEDGNPSNIRLIITYPRWFDVIEYDITNIGL